MNPMISQEEIDLIDRYLESSLTGFELKDFLERLEKDDDFRERVSFRNMLTEGIQASEDKRLAATIEEFIDYRKPRIPLALKLIFTFLFITACGIILWDYIGPGSSSEKHNFLSFDLFRDRKNEPALQNEEVNNSNKEFVPLTNEKKSSQVDTLKEGSEMTPDSLNSGIAQEQEIVVKKDQFIVGYFLRPKMIGEKKSSENPESSIAKNTVERLNPAGDLPETEDNKIQNYSVEFWVSPVNYKGYKLSHDKLILFGIDEPEAIDLFIKEEKLLLKYHEDYYNLEPTENFSSLIQIVEIPSALK